MKWDRFCRDGSNLKHIESQMVAFRFRFQGLLDFRGRVACGAARKNAILGTFDDFWWWIRLFTADKTVKYWIMLIQFSGEVAKSAVNTRSVVHVGTKLGRWFLDRFCVCIHLVSVNCDPWTNDISAFLYLIIAVLKIFHTREFWVHVRLLLKGNVELHYAASLNCQLLAIQNQADWKLRTHVIWSDVKHILTPRLKTAVLPAQLHHKSYRGNLVKTDFLYEYMTLHR